MTAYFIIQVEVNDPEAFEPYRLGGPALLAKHGGEYIVRGGEDTVLEGDAPLARQVVVRFPDRKAAMGWYDCEEYTQLRKIRQSSATTRFMLVDGTD